MAEEIIVARKRRVTRAPTRQRHEAGVKRCTGCKSIKAHAEFAKQSTRWDGLNPKCRECCAEYRRQRTLRDPDWQKRQSAKNREQNRERINAQARAAYHRDIEATRERDRRNRLRNREKIRKQRQKWREENREAANEASRLAKRRRRAANKEAGIKPTDEERRVKRELNAIYRSRKRDEVNARERANRLKRIENDPSYIERCRKSSSEYHKRNPDKIRAIRRNRKARIRNAHGSHSEKDVLELFSIQKGKCAHSWCRVSLKNGYHVDHVIPVARGGSNERRNLQLLCQPCNQKKWAKHPIEVAQENGLLL